MNPDLAYYVIRYYPQLMTRIEWRANMHLISTLKATLGRDDVAAQQEAVNQKDYWRWATDDPEVLELTGNGRQDFRARTATRILADHRNEVFLNHSPRCHELARTPKAQQCRFCGYHWDSADHAARED